jgi:hypothetical protein
MEISEIGIGAVLGEDVPVGEVVKLTIPLPSGPVTICATVRQYSYDFRIDTPEEHLAGHGMTRCRKDAGGRWRMLSVDNSLKEAVGAPDRVH